ncbi:universal stress protein Sll1388-like [Argopecten irradians]|uniref:universal stress protein Sll1388-like n=1 Tax=Argopecten irradians TaxID=31199 RepID=UPI00371240FD
MMADNEDQPQKTNIVCMDGSEEAEKAFKSIWQPSDYGLILQAYREEEKRADAIVEKLQQDLKVSGVKGEVLKSSGEAGPTVIGIAQNRKANMILTGCRGLGTMRRTFLGSVSDYIMHHSEVPVLVCRH